MRTNHYQLPYMVPASLMIAIVTALALSSPAFAKKPAPGKKYLLLQDTVWAANHRLTLTPTLMQLDAQHQGFVIQYSVPSQTVCGWNEARKEYAKEQLANWLKTFRNLAVLLSWSSAVSKPSEITTVNEWGLKATQSVYKDIKLARSFYASEIGQRRKPAVPTTGYMTAVRLEGVDPNVGVVLTRIYGYPESTEIPLEVYAVRNLIRTHSSIHTTKFEENPKIRFPSEFVPPKDFKQIKDFQRIISPSDKDIDKFL